MLQIQITNLPNQKTNVVLPDGTQFTLAVRFIPMQYGWFITELTYGEFSLKGYRICNSPNMLHAFRNRIPFGLACLTKGNREPNFQDDFSSEASRLFLLTEAEVEAYTDYLSGQV